MSDFKAFSPTGSLIVVRPEKKDERFSKSRGGVILPENADFKLAAGTVLAVGPGEFQNGFRCDADVAVGNRVLVEKTRASATIGL